MNKSEILPIVNEDGIVIGKENRSVCHNRTFILHPVIHIHILNSNKLFLQKRSFEKKIQPGKWDTSVGGHITYGDDVETSAYREAEEELGIVNELELIPIMEYIWESAVEREYIHVFKCFYSGSISIDNSEVIDGKYWSRKEIEKSLNKNIFTPNFEYEYMMINEKLFDKPLNFV